MSKLLPFLLLSLLSVVGCSSSGSSNPSYERVNDNLEQSNRSAAPSDIRSIQDIPQFEETENKVAPGFLFSLNHPTDGKLQGSFRVGFDGVLKLPYGVKIAVAGLTFSDVKAKVVEAYTSFFQRGAQNVSFNLVSKDYYVEVRGYVKKSGQYLVKRKESIDKVIDAAGGLNGTMKQDFFVASIKQQDLSYSVSLNQYYENNVLGSSFTWTGGDVIFIKNSNEDSATQIAATVEVIGGVQSPGKTLYKEDANIFYYLGKRGGVVSDLGYEEAYVIRKGPKGLERIQFNITEMSEVPVIKPGDTILLGSETRTFSDKVWERTTQAASILLSIAFIIIAL
jgi:protein involved in polysaccharide export with SLBB domain